MAHTVPGLVARERELLNEEAWLVAALKLIKSHRISLQVERLQLQSMLNNKSDIPETEQVDLNKDDIDESNTQPIGQSIKNVETIPSTSAAIPQLEQLDEAESAYNNRELNLSIINDIDSILSGKYANKSSEEEEEESSDDGW